ncbi:subunit I/II of b(o/a)3-type cytochrome C oxidase [Bacillus massilinigeriensis]|nr:subunit I/II of b(o/a)3-type cytochrome C oxidase [Bacillus mediterraneensis]
MPQPVIRKNTKAKTDDSSSLKGTLVSVFMVGLFLIATWVGVFYLFMDRF